MSWRCRLSTPVASLPVATLTLGVVCSCIRYRSMDRSLTNEEIDALQNEIRDIVEGKLSVELR